MILNRRSFLLRASTAGGAFLCAANRDLRTAFAAEAGRKPNVVFVLADDWGWGDLGCYGHPHLKTPFLDELAREGILFTQAYVNAPVCSPSRTAFMTGHFPARHGIHGHFAGKKLNEQRDMPQFLDPGVTTVTRLFQDAGYAVGHFGKWHLGGGPGENGDLSAPPPSAYGIDESRVYVGNGPNWEEVADFIPRSSELIVDETIRFIVQHSDKPFFVQTWLKDSHAFLDPTEEQRAPYKKFGGALETYYGVITNADRYLGRLLECLYDFGLAGNTIVIFSSDNGPEDIHVANASHSGVGSAGPFRGRKRSLYEGGLRVPLIVRWPGKTPAGQVNDSTVISGVDFLPTMCALAGITPPEGLSCDGEDLSEALLGEPVLRDKPLFWEFRSGVAGDVINHSPWLAVRDGDWKLLLNPDGSRRELYNILQDPRELDNQAQDRPRLTKRLEKVALAWQATLPKAYVSKDAGKDSYRWPEKNQ